MSGWSTPRTVRARKNHRCDLCHRVIDAGEEYQRHAGFDSGTAWSWKECAHCDLYLQLVDKDPNPWGDGYGPESIQEIAREPSSWFQARLGAGYLMRWRTRSGVLLPLPQEAA